MGKSQIDMIAFHNKGMYTLLVDRIVDSTEKIACLLRDETTKTSLGKKVSLDWGGFGDGATLNTIPRNVSWEKASKIKITLGPSAYEKFYSQGRVMVRCSSVNVLVEIVDNLREYLL